MSASDYALAKQEVLNSKAPPADMLEALCVIERQRQIIAAQERNAAWACGRKGDGTAKIQGLTDTLTSLLRMFAAQGVVRYGDMHDLHRHKSALAKALKAIAPTVKISTLIGEGYEITAGWDEVYRLLHAGKTPSLRAPGFTPKQTRILSYLATRGSAHVDQFACLQRHISNVRAKLKKLNLHKSIVITTHPGEGLYTLDDAGRETARRLLAGELTPKAERKAQPPKLQLVAAA